MKPVVLKEVLVVNEGTIRACDVLFRNGRIEKIESGISVKGAVTEINGTGKHLFPGAIDDQVHFREPGLTHKATIYSESKAAVAGGVTSFMEMPNTKPPAVTHEILEEKYRTAQITSLANFSFYLGTSNDNLEEVKRTDPKKICGVKIFMGSSTGQLVVDDEQALENIFRFSPTLIATHCETDSVIKQHEEEMRAKFGDAVPIELHPQIRTAEQCASSSKKAIALAKKYDSRLHILHISTADETLLFDNSIPLEKKRITAEACVHYLWFNSNDYKTLGPQIKCNPAIKSEHDQQEILKALLENKIDVLATDHAPHLWEEKYAQTPDGKLNYFKSPSGLPLVQHSLNMMLEFYKQGKSSLEKIAEKMSHAPAVLFHVKDRGFIREGYYADLVLADLKQSYTVSKNNLYYKCGWSPLEGTNFHSVITHTFVNGRLVFAENVFDESVNGMRLEFELR